MIRCPHMLLIGAAARDAGKTELAARLVSHLRMRGPVVGAKVTVVSRQHEGCARGGEGCGACRLGGPFALVEEWLSPGLGDKDNQRLLMAGADRVWWLRVHEDALEAGARALLAVAPPGVPLVVESNRLRRLVQPGLFLVIQDPRSGAAKPSYTEVRPLADLVVVRLETGFDLDVQRIGVADGCPVLHPPAAAAALAGASGRAR